MGNKELVGALLVVIVLLVCGMGSISFAYFSKVSECEGVMEYHSQLKTYPPTPEPIDEVKYKYGRPYYE